MTHALTHMNNPKITRAPLPALLPTILAGLFILAGCGGGALPIDVPIATESTDVANKTESNVSVAGFLSVGEEPPVDTVKSAPPADTPPDTPIVQVQKPEPKPEQEEVKKQVQAPAPVFEVAVAPASPPQRSFSQSPPEPQTSTETVKRSDATGESHASDSVVTFADWVDSFGIVLPTQAQTKTTRITGTAPFKRFVGAEAVVYNDQGQILAKDGGGVLTYTDQVTKNAGGDKHANGDPIILTTTTTITITAPPSGRERSTAYDANGNEIADLRASSSNYDVGSEINIVERVTLTESQRDYIAENAMIDDQNEKQEKATITRTDTEGVKNQFLQGVGSGLDEGPAGVVLSRGGLNLATATFGGRKLGGDAADGVGFFRGFTTENPINPAFTDYPDIKRHNYAGIYSNTNLGAPISGTSMASWNGRIRTIGYFQFDTDFTLEITFGDNNTGTLNFNVDKLLNPKNVNQFIQITSATYDANGVISGEIIIDEDNDNRNIQAQHGFLTGLIGEEGAVAAFLSSGDKNAVNTKANGSKESITQGFHEFGYAGGFVAHPTAIAAPVAPPNLNVRINAWTSGFANLKRNVKRRTTNDAESSNAFLLRDDPAKRPSWKKPEGGFLALSALGGDTTDGVDFFPADITIINVRSTAYTTRTQRTYHAGLWDSTDLGLAIPLGVAFNGDMTAMWKGKFSVFQGANARFDDDDFTLAIDFLNNSFSATVAAGAKDYYLSGNYNARGLMTGRVSYLANANADTNTNGIISGLIGAEGAVGAFVSNAEATSKATAIRNGDADVVPDKNAIAGGTGATGYAGGFVASPISPPPAVVDVSDINYTDTRTVLRLEYRRKTAEEIEMEEDEEEKKNLQKVIRTEEVVSSDINYADIPTTVAGLADTPNPYSRFLRIEGLNIDTRGLTNPVIHTRRRDYTAGSAGFGDGYAVISSHGYVGILPTTDLGAALPVGPGQTTDARWNGMYSLSGNGDFAPNTPIWFDINFAEGTLTRTAPLANSLTNNITINTTFGADGVMHGTFSTDKVFRKVRGEAYTINQVNTNVIGLIGEEGLVGIMHGNAIVSTTVTGGFVASP